MSFKFKVIYSLVVFIAAYFYYSYNYEELQNVQNEIAIEKEQPVPPKPISFPVHGTIFLDSNIISYDDPSTFQSLTDAGRGTREMFDRRVDKYIIVKAFLFDVTYDDGLKTEVKVNPEFNTVDSARVEAEKYAKVVGNLPTALRKEVRTISINKGLELYGGGGGDILIHTGQTPLYEKDGILEETLVHEAAHTSLDLFHETKPAWLESQKNDKGFISDYAEENPGREDIAETFLLYLAIRYRSDRITIGLRDSIIAQVPNRIKYFDNLKLEMYPID